MGATVTTCLDCGEELRRVYDQPPLGHLYKSAVTQEATAEQDGVRTYTCIRCSNTYTESIPKLEAPAKGTDGGASSLPDADLPDGQQPEDPSLTAPGGEGNGSGGESQDGSEEQGPSGGMDNPSDTEGGLPPCLGAHQPRHPRHLHGGGPLLPYLQALRPGGSGLHLPRPGAQVHL